MAGINVLLTPVEELPPGSLGAIRRQVTESLISLASTQLKIGSDSLVARDIRPYDDLAWCTHANFVTSALTTNIWNAQTDGALTGYQEMIVTTGTPSNTMADQRFVAIYGVRDMRTCFATKVTQAISLLKVDVGNSTKAIWDTTKLAAYKQNPVGVCSSAVIIPQNTVYQIYGYIITVSTVCWVSLEGVVVEPRGKVISP